MDVSLIICTRNRGEKLMPCFKALARLKPVGAMECVIVDNASTDRTRAEIEAFAATAPFPVRYVYEPVAGLSSARNAGLAHSSGALVVFTDDDCYIEPDFLEQAKKLFSDPRLGYASGRVRLYDPSDYPVTINESCEPVVIPPRSYVRPGAVKGANMVFRRSVLDEIGHFDVDFGSGSYFAAEDCDAAGKASLHGYEGRYAPELVVWHHHGRKGADVEKLHKSYDIGRGAYHMKLLMQGRGFRPRLQGWIEFPRRILHRPRSLLWEMAGALGFVALQLSGRSRQAKAMSRE
ncbi:glycosyl transferase [Terrihabitans soli]|uniref:Glycosyl transferase n=1 Tax=Terrihabitans soli TaxID=708113 RepID=A0A6S6QVH4_9HYPH|nr:glycosyltransferase family 2 protein [Terrihabitans soli]BCJ91927.1 glycosyl transferase [Terrihabitans soli]